MKLAPRFVKLIAATLCLFLGVLFTGCESSGVSAEPQIHGKAGVQVESKDTSRIRPVR